MFLLKVYTPLFYLAQSFNSLLSNCLLVSHLFRLPFRYIHFPFTCPLYSFRSPFVFHFMLLYTSKSYLFFFYKTMFLYPSIPMFIFLNSFSIPLFLIISHSSLPPGAALPHSAHSRLLIYLLSYIIISSLITHSCLSTYSLFCLFLLFLLFNNQPCLPYPRRVLHAWLSILIQIKLKYQQSTILMAKIPGKKIGYSINANNKSNAVSIAAPKNINKY